MRNKWVGDCAATDAESQRLCLHSLIWATEQPCLQAFWIHQLSRCNTRFQHNVSDRLPSWNYLNEFMYKPTVWTYSHLQYNNIANWCCSQTGTNSKTRTLDYFRTAVFHKDFLLQLLTYFRIFRKCLLDNRGWVLPLILIVIYKVQKSCDFHFYINPVPGATQKKWAATALGWKQFLHNLIALCCYSLTCAVCICQFTEMFALRSNLMGLVHLCANIWKPFIQFFQWDLLTRFQHFALWNNSWGTTCSFFRNILNSAKILPRGVSSPLA